MLIGLRLGQLRGTLSAEEFKRLAHELEILPKSIETVLKSENEIQQIAKNYKDATNFLYLGRGYNFPVALEGARSLKSLFAEGYPATEMKHGPIALIDKNMPVVVIATNKGHYEKIVSNIKKLNLEMGKLLLLLLGGQIGKGIS